MHKSIWFTQKYDFSFKNIGMSINTQKCNDTELVSGLGIQPCLVNL